MSAAPCALVVDDAPTARHRIAVLLRLAGWRVHEAVGVQDAARAAEQLDPVLIVTEMRLPGGSGVELVHRLRRAGSHARFLFVTSRPTARIRAEAAAAGVPCLAKPVQPGELVRFLRDRPEEPPARGRLHVRAVRCDTAGGAAA